MTDAARVDVLEASGLCVRFGGVRAVHDVSLHVGSGKLVGLIGPNGAGKTTLIDALTGIVDHSGRITLDGRDISGEPTHRRSVAGLARTWQAGALFDDLTVRSNLLVADEPFSLAGMARDILRRRRGTPPEVDDALRRLGLEDVADCHPDQLPLGRRKLVGVARALVTRPSLVCLDEPAAGLDTIESRSFGERLRTLVDSGLSGLLVEHDMGLVMSVCDDIYVLEFGEVIAHGSPEEVRKDERVREAYLGAGRGTFARPAAVRP